MWTFAAGSCATGRQRSTESGVINNSDSSVLAIFSKPLEIRPQLCKDTIEIFSVDSSLYRLVGMLFTRIMWGSLEKKFF